SCSVWAEQPIFWETETTAAQRDGYSPPCSSTIRTARVRTSGENLFVVLLIRLYPTWELEPPTDPARFRFPNQLIADSTLFFAESSVGSGFDVRCRVGLLRTVRGGEGSETRSAAA